MTPERRAELEAAYCATIYRAGGFVLRVGDPSPILEPWAFLTACNPMSETLPDEENAARMKELRRDLATYEVYGGEGASPDGRWREPSILVINITEADAHELALKHGQAAFLFGERGGSARLVWVTPPPGAPCCRRTPSPAPPSGP